MASASVAADEFEDAYGEPLKRTLDLNTWQDAPDFQQMYERMSAEVAEAVDLYDRVLEIDPAGAWRWKRIDFDSQPGGGRLDVYRTADSGSNP